MPYTTAGTSAIGGLGDLVGLNGPDKVQAAIASLKGSPIYTSLFNNGQEAVLQNAAATGGLRGGNTQRGLMDFGSDVLSQVYANQIGNLGNLANLGLGATGSVSSFGSHAADNTTALTGKIGDAQANNFLTRGYIDGRNWANFGSFLDGNGGASGSGSSGGNGFNLASALASIF